MAGANIQDTRTRISASAEVKFYAGSEIVHTRVMDVTWLDDWQVSLFTAAQLATLCTQHLKVKARRQYKTMLEADEVLRARVNKRRTKLALSTVTYKLQSVPADKAQSSSVVSTQVASLTMLKVALTELEEIRDFMKEHFGDEPAVKRFFARKRTTYAELARAQRKITQ